MKLPTKDELTAILARVDSMLEGEMNDMGEDLRSLAAVVRAHAAQAARLLEVAGEYAERELAFCKTRDGSEEECQASAYLDDAEESFLAAARAIFAKQEAPNE